MTVSKLSKEMQTDLAKVTTGEPWYGSNVKDILEAIDYKIITKKVNGQHNIAEILFHMSQWTLFASEKINGLAPFDITINSQDDWKIIEHLNKKDWIALKDHFFQLSDRLSAEITNLPVTKWSKKVAGRKYSYADLMKGIIQHNIYHLGQIALLKNILKD